MAMVKKQTNEEADITSVDASPTGKNSYFISDKKDVDFIPSGCVLLDLVLGGGWALSRMSNIVGDKSSGKTLLAIEACANFHRKFEDGQIWYNEAEGAFDPSYAQCVGLPLDSVFFVTKTEPQDTLVPSASDTVEGLARHIEKVIEYHKDNNIPQGLYIIDSMDAFSDEAERDRDIGDGSYGGSKPKKIGELFRRYVRELEKANIHLMVISQVRDKIGVTFGAKKTRSGGKALDFYSSQTIWLAEAGKEVKTVLGHERPVGVNIAVKNTKNKVGLPFRTASYYLEFGYGIDEIASCVDWLLQDKKQAEWLKDELGVTKAARKRNLARLKALPDDEYFEVIDKLQNRVKKVWNDIEQAILPVRSKYDRRTQD